MARYDNAYSRLVAWLKILLPLLALAILSTLFLLSRRVDPEDGIPYASVDLEELAREPRLTAPHFAGVTADGAALTVTAGIAYPDGTDPGRISALDVVATIESDTLTAEITAAAGAIDPATSQMTLSGGVRIETSAGYRLTTDHLTSALQKTRIETDAAVSAEAPMGRIVAGGMLLRALDPEGKTHVLVFNGGVKLIYLPQSREP